ncbi:MAG: hypothetical protein EYC70_00335 [Planctomycetota bacterium]|nr:MAG: hypothetical protein EYC70_00335 [Planctomycetota bacterium]
MIKRSQEELGRRTAILSEIFDERDRQDAKFGEQNHPPLLWLAIAQEEIGEAAQAVLHVREGKPGASLEKYRAEMLQVAAVALSALEAFDRHPQRCRRCGCTEVAACPGGCAWLEEDLCTACGVEPA